MNLAIRLILMVLTVIACESDKNGPPKAPLGYPTLTLIKAAYAVGLIKAVDTKPSVPASLNQFKDIEYKHVGNSVLKMDIYQPKNINEPRPVLVFIHGGGWRGGKKEDYLRYLVDFAQKGYITASISYRLVSDAHYPAAVEDVKCAIRWIRAHAADYLIDSRKIAVIGGSAGGHLAMMIGYSSDVPELDGPCLEDSVSSRVQAVVNLYGPVDLTTKYARTHKLVKNFLNQPFDSNPYIYAQASPYTHITKDDPPTLIFHGTLDELVPISQADSLKSKLDRKGVANEYHRLKWWPHSMDLAKSVNDYCQYYMNAFFEKYVPITY